MVYLAENLFGHYWDLGFLNYQNKKKSVAELGHSDLLSVYESSFARTPISQYGIGQFKMADEVAKEKKKHENGNFQDWLNEFGIILCQNDPLVNLITKIAKNMKQTTSHELLNGF